MSFEKVLIIEDDSVVRSLLNEIFLRRKCSVAAAKKLTEAEALIAKESFDLIMLDIRLPDGDGEKFLEQLAMLPERPLVIVMTGYGTIESAVGCMRAGAFDYVMKPFSPSQIDVILRKAQAYQQLLQVNRLLSDQSEDHDALLGRSPAMARLRQLIERVAPTDATVFIAGESGTGKEMMAREIYRRSPRRQQPFIKVNCAAISENLIESEFFGHERGAFTGATERREGRFELANHGTLLLDEISEIPANLQAKLLRVLQEREFERVGGNRTIKVNVRIIATSTRELLQHVERPFGAAQVGREHVGRHRLEVPERLVDVDRQASARALLAHPRGRPGRRDEIVAEDLHAAEAGRRGRRQLVFEGAGEAHGCDSEVRVHRRPRFGS